MGILDDYAERSKERKSAVGAIPEPSQPKAAEDVAQAQVAAAGNVEQEAAIGQETKAGLDAIVQAKSEISFGEIPFANIQRYQRSFEILHGKDRTQDASIDNEASAFASPTFNKFG